MINQVKSLSGKLALILTAALLSSVLLAPIGVAAQSTQSIRAVPGHRLSQSQTKQLESKIKNSANKSGSGSNSSLAYYNWSGYAATATLPFLSVESKFVQPAVTCTVPGAWTLFWVGFDGFSNNTVEQDGTAAECSNAAKPTPTYYAWWEMYPTNYVTTMPMTVKPGNTISATVGFTKSNNEYSLNVSNLSNGQSYTKDTTCAAGLTCARNSAEWIIERPTVSGSYTPLADWGTMSLINDEAALSANTSRRGTTDNFEPISSFTNYPLNMVNYPSAASFLANVGALSNSGTSFQDTWTAAQ